MIPIRAFILVALVALAVPIPAIQVPQTRREFVDVVAADIRSLRRGRTEVVLYRPTLGYKDVTRTITLSQRWLLRQPVHRTLTPAGDRTGVAQRDSRRARPRP